MRVWIDAQLPPSLAKQMRSTFSVEAEHVFDLRLARATDEAIFQAARRASAIVITKDVDFVRLQEQHGAPPQLLWLTLGNLSNAEVRGVLEANWARAAELFATGEPIVEIGRHRTGSR